MATQPTETNEFLALVYGPPKYFNKMSIAELRTEAQAIQNALLLGHSVNPQDREQLKQYGLTFQCRIKQLNKQYTT